MTEKEIISKTIDFVKTTLKDAEGGHDWFHIERVWRNAQTIATTENVNMFIVELGALLHDIADSKFHDGNEDIGPEMATGFLLSSGVRGEIIRPVEAIIRNISFKGGNFESNYQSPELAVVQDAHRLDAMGAIGIARAFNYGGFKNRSLHNPALPPDLNMNKESYKQSSAPTINHFYEKLLLLKDRMNTETGKRLAERRHNFMLSYLEEFYKDWEGI